MALSNQEIEQLQQQLKEKKEEIKVIYDQLTEAGAVALDDESLDQIAGGGLYLGGSYVTGRHNPSGSTDNGGPRH